MNVTYEALNKKEEGTKHWSTILSSMVFLSIVTAVIAATVFDFDFVESIAICVAVVVLVSALAVFTLDKPTPQLLISFLVTGLILTPLYSGVGQGIAYIMNILNTLQ